MTSAVSRLLNVLLWIGMLTFFFDVWELSVPFLLSALEWLEANPNWIAFVSLYLACVIVKSYLSVQSVPLMTKATVRNAGLRPDALRDMAAITLSCVIWSVWLSFVVFPVMIQERSRFWRCRTRREIVETARRDEGMMRFLKRMGRWGLIR